MSSSLLITSAVRPPRRGRLLPPIEHGIRGGHAESDEQREHHEVDEQSIRNEQ
jgi:hypothetical protein